MVDTTEDPSEVILALRVRRYEDDRPSVLELRTEGGDYIHPELERRVADAIRRYPNQDAEAWLGPVAAISLVEDWLTDAGQNAKQDQPRIWIIPGQPS